MKSRKNKKMVKLSKSKIKQSDPVSDEEDNFMVETEEEDEDEDYSDEGSMFPEQKINFVSLRKSERDEKSSENIGANKKRKVTDDVTENAGNKKIKSNKHLYDLPTTEELNQLRETENLFHSNLFRLQIEEILSEVKLKEKYKTLFDAWFVKLKENIESIKETEEAELSNMKPLKKLSVKVPIGPLNPIEKGTYRYSKPSNIKVIGSYALNTTISTEVVIDVMVEMPSKLFQKLDYQNYRYLRKRAIYLAYIAANVDDSIIESKTFIGDSWKPIIKLVPKGKLGKKVQVHLHLAAAEGSFKLNRFLPEKNSIRPNWFFGNDGVKDEAMFPTPHYNSVILHDLTMWTVNSQNIKFIKEYPNIRDGIILLKIWLAQRQLTKGHGAFNGHVLTMYVLYLLRTRKLNTYMSSYQIVRNVWNCLALSNWCEDGINMCPDEESKTRVAEYHKYYDCVFLDITGYHNLAANITKETFVWVRNQAEMGLKYLDNAHIDSFQALFMRQVPFYRAFDHFVCIHDTAALKNLVSTKSSQTDKLDYGVNIRSQAVKLLVGTLKEGLGDRVHNLGVLPKEYEEWAVSDKIPYTTGKIFIGLHLNPDRCFDIADKGPQANLPEALNFRKYWGEKSELRRFQDGTIRETVVWSKGKTLAEKRIICKKIVHFLFENKLSLSKKQFLYVGDQTDQFLRLNKAKITKFAYGTGEEASLRAVTSFHELEKEISSLSDLPLQISGIQGSSPVLRYTDVFPPLATVHRPEKGVTREGESYLLVEDKVLEKSPEYLAPIEASIQLSLSGKWPEELEALRKTKAAFHIQIAECLRKQRNLKAQGNSTHIDVMKDGFVFRLSVAHQKEIALMKEETDDKGIIRYRDNEKAIELETKLFILPKLSSALHGLHSQQPTFGPACCLAKRWLSAQLLDNSHIPDLVTELLMAAMYLTPEPYQPAQHPQVAFLRFLEMFARDHWSTDPIIVNFNNEMSREEIVAVESLFGTSRNTLPPLFISTPYDQQKSMWTKKCPSLLILSRIGALARESLKLYETQLLSCSVLDLAPLFKPPLTAYDCLIHLKDEFNPRRFQALDLNDEYPVIGLHPFKEHSLQKIPVIDFDPVQLYLKDLRNGYDEFALFFHDTYGGAVIGVLLKPTALEPRYFKVANVNCRYLDKNGKLSLNVSAMIEDFYLLGKGLVKSIEVQSKRISLN